ncbi:MAG: class I SAM-dependent methyltransferase [Ruminococcus sp.]|nr:class I SAM-dependent methyltransferase [Ruminococcus sp.]
MFDFVNKKKFYRNFFIRKFIRISREIVYFTDGIKDIKICGCSLVKYVPSLYRKSMGATGSQSTSYRILDEIFRGASFSENDNFIDVGCGKGRILAYMVGKGHKFPLNGVELNEDVAKYAQNWAARYNNINIINGSAFDLDYNKYTVLFMGRPFEPEMFYQFIDKLENELVHPIKLYYWVDQQSGDYLNDRKGWTMLKREKIFTKKGFFLAQVPQRYSIWTYDPNEK